MKMLTKALFFTSLFQLFISYTFGQVPANYYDGISGTGYTLKTNLHNLIRSHTVRSYNNLWTDFQITDRDNYYENDASVMDMYSEIPAGTDSYEFSYTSDQCGTYSGEGGCYNREHSFPKSWWGGSTSDDQYTDLFHLVPTDGYVNNKRSSYAFGEVGTASWISTNGSKLGSCSYPGYTGGSDPVFEPIDEFKGDFARNYFYMATCYESVIAGWETNNAGGDAMLDGTSDHVFENWALNMLIEWHNNDPVSQKELDRNDAIYNIQGNANPFINHPEYVAQIWGTPTVKPEPDNYPTAFIASDISDSQIDLSWTDATGTNLPDAYLILANTTNSFTAPVDANDPAVDSDLSDGSAVVKVSQGSEGYSFTGLNSETQYFFKIWSYANSGTDIDFKLNGTPPISNVTTQAPAASTCEDFNDQTSNSYGTSFILSTGTWTCSDAGNFAYCNTNMGSPGFTINDDKVNAHITTPAINTCGTVSFNYAYINGNSTNVFELQTSTDGTNFTTVDTHILGASADQSWVSYSFDVNSSSNPIYIRVLSNNQDAHLFIDDFCWTDYTVSGPEVDWCNLQWPVSGNIRNGDVFNVYAQVFETGVTEAAGQGAGITAWIGYNTTNDDPSNVGWTWVPATYNGDSGNNDEYTAEIGSALAAGTYYYASRFQLSGGAYKYGGYNAGGGGFWDGATNVSNVLTVDVVDWCNIQNPENGTVALGVGFNVYAQIYEDTETNPAGQAANISSWIGYSTVDNDPVANPGDWTWVAASYNTDVGNNDEYILDIENAIGAGGTYYYVSRFQINSGPYAYGGFNTANNEGPWTNTYLSGTGNKSGQLIIQAPTITTSVISLNGFTYVEGSGPSAEQSYTVEGTNLTDDITITPPANWEISLTAGGPYQTTPITLAHAGGTVATTTIYTIMSAGLLNVNSPFSGNIACVSTGATTKNIAVDGTVTIPTPNAWINEIHYDNNGGDVNEGVEIVIENPGSYTLSDFQVNIYNGNGGGSYGSETLDNFVVGNTAGTATIYTWAVSMQNGAPDGLALSYNGTLIQFLSYEGSFTATDGPANGVASTDIGVVEAGNSTVGHSLQLSGTGCSYGDFTWQGSAANTMGTENNSQTICGGSGPTIDITGTDPTSDDFVQNSTDNIFYQIDVAVAGGTDQEVSQIQFDAISTLADLDALISGYTLYYSTDATLEIGTDSDLGTVSSTATTNQTNILYDFSATPITITSGNTGYFFITTDVLLTANVGSTVQATNTDATFTTVGGATGTENYTVGNEHTIVLLKSFESDIISAGNEAVSISSLENTTGPLTSTEGVQVWEVTIRDGGAGSDSDSQPTIVESITFSRSAGNTMDDWAESVLSCDIFNGTTHLGQAVITANQIQFSGSPLITVPDDGTVTLSIRLSITTSPNLSGLNNDGDDFGFQISQTNVTASASGSGFSNFSSINSANGNNVFEVIATDFNYSVIPTAVNIATDFTVETEAVDINGNRDLDYTSSVTLSKNAGVGNLTSVAGLSQNFVSGVYQWTDMQMDTQGVFSILASDGGTLNNTVSPDINAIDIIWYQGFQDPPLAIDTWSFSGGGTASTDAKGQTDTHSWKMVNGDFLTMDNIDISGYTSVQFSLGFAATGVNTSNELNLTVSYDGGTTWVKAKSGGNDYFAQGFSGATYNFGYTNAADPYCPENPFIVDIPDGAMQFTAKIQGSSTYYIDDVQLIGYLEPLKITTLNFMGATTTTAIVNAELEYTGGETITERGIVWDISTNPSPTVGSNFGKYVDAGVGYGYYTADETQISGLTSGATYNARAYVTTVESGTVYGNELSFTTCNGTEDCLNNTDLMITEYIESSGGGGENNAIEIFNGTGSDVNLKHYRLQHDDDPIPGYDDYSMTYYDFGDVVLPNGETYVIAYDQASAPELKLKAAGGFADVATSILAIGGNEQFQLAKINGDRTAYNAIEHVGYESNFGERKTFARRSEIIHPIIQSGGGGAGDLTCDPNTNGEWIVYPDNYYGGLGIYRLTLDWQGDVSSDWFNTSNWELDRAPTPSISVKITDVSGSGGVQPIISDNASDSAKVQDLIIESGAALTIASDGEMTVSGKITNNGSASDLVIKSDATGTGSLIYGSGTPAATVERFLTGDQWHYMFPALSSTASSVFTDEGGTPNPNYYVYDETTLDYWTASTVYETSGWTNGPVTLTTGNGFVFNRVGLADKVYSQTGGNLFTGQKDFSVSLTTHSGAFLQEFIDNGGVQNWTFFDGWNLVGNPYTSAIDWDEVSKTNIEAGMYLYDDLTDKYQYYISGGGDSPYNSIGISANNVSSIIPSGQGIFVKATGSGIFSLQNDDRVHNSQTYWKNNSDIIPNMIRLNIEKDNYTDETVIRTLSPESGVTESHDGAYDAYKLFVWDKTKPQLFSKNENNTDYYAINSIPEFTSENVIPLGVYIGESGDYTINMTENNFKNTHIWLEDAVSGINTNLITNPAYAFSQVAETNNERFYLHFGVNTAPILNFEIPDQEVSINEYFDYTISQEAFIDNDFEDDLMITASLESGENLPDWLSFDSDLRQFYGTPSETQSIDIRVTATDIFGAAVSDVYTLTVKKSSSVTVNNRGIIHVFPNPAKDKLNIIVPDINGKAEVSIFDITGKKVLNKEAVNKSEVLDINLLTKGIYIIEIRYQNQIFKKKLIKE